MNESDAAIDIGSLRRLSARGLSAAEIAAEMGVTAQQVYYHSRQWAITVNKPTRSADEEGECPSEREIAERTAEIRARWLRSDPRLRSSMGPRWEPPVVSTSLMGSSLEYGRRRN